MGETHRSGDAVVVVGHGVGHVVSIDAARLVVRLREGEVAINVADLGTMLRPVVDRAAAQWLLERLCQRCVEERTLPKLRSLRELARAPLDRQVEYTRLYFRRKEQLHAGEENLIQTASENVFAELAASLRLDEAGLRVAVKRGRAEVEAPSPVRPLPAAPSAPDAELLRSFWLGARALVGERPERGDGALSIAVKPGAWHAYLVEKDADEDDALEGLLLVHAEAARDRRLCDVCVDVGGVNVEGGTIGILDAAALRESDLGVDELERLRNEGNAFGDRGVEVSTWGDGDHRVLVDARDAASAILVLF
jgi:hypothetical protein